LPDRDHLAIRSVHKDQDLAMTEPAAPTAGPLSFGPFTVTPRERLVTRDGVALALGAKAFDILIALTSRPNQVVSKWDLMALVWPGLTVEEANLRFHVAALRKALGDGKDGARYITTLSGRGYCFVAPISKAEIAAERRPAQRTELPPVKLPNRLQRMVGRDDAVAAVSNKLIGSRFVTIVGLGGVGKTAVAVAIAHDLLETFSDAAHFVDLAALSDPDLVITSILLMLGLPAQTDDPLPALLAHLGDKRMLLILDNCEHVIAAAAPLAAEIFHAAPHVHILATSREALRVEGEQVYRLAPLAVPPDNPGLTAAAAQPGGHLLVRELGLNTTRTPVLGVLVRMGAQVREAIEDVDQLEPRGIVEITGAMLKGTVIQGKEVAQLIDELPVLAVAGALANGTTIIRQAQELRVKETDRIAAIAHNLRAMGAQVIELSDGLEIHGPAPLRGGRVPSFGDHRIAMAFAIAGLFADGETIIQDTECVEISYPGFRNALEQFMTTKRGPGSTPVIGSRSMAPVDE